MKRIRMIGLCLVAVFAFSAIVASSASALTEILFKFTNEASPIASGGTFTSKGGASKLQTLGGSTISCTEVRDNGSFLSAHLGLALILFLGCGTTIFGGNHNCTTSGQPTGHIHLLNLVFHLGLAHLGTNTTIPAIIILLPSGGVTFKCEIANVTVTGNVIGALEKTTGGQVGIKEPAKAVNLVYKLKSTGMQELTEILMSLNGGALTTAHLTTEDVLETQESGQESSDTLEEFKNSKGEATEIELIEDSSPASKEVSYKFTNGNIEESGTFLSKGGETKLLASGGSEIKCKSVENNGEFKNAHLGLLLMTLEGCKAKVAGFTFNCTSSGEPTGSIHMSKLLSYLGLAHTGSSTTVPAVIALLPAGGVSFNCEVGAVKLTGSLISALQKTNGEQMPIGSPFKEANYAYKQSSGKQEFTLILLPLGGGTLTGQHLAWEVFGEAGEETALEGTDTLDGFRNHEGEVTEVELVET